jgi:prepilin-type N-terminal cleavage/methylation domain-containing protein
MKRRGFTLIELLVVIAIIGVLSSVVLASLNSARKKANEAAIKSQVLQFATLMELEYDDTGSYAALNRSWVGTSRSCSAAGFGGNYAAQAVRICEGIRNAITNPSVNEFYTGVNTAAGFSNSTQYSVMAKLSDGYFCRGSSGGSSEGSSGADSWLGEGCYGNP